MSLAQSALNYLLTTQKIEQYGRWRNTISVISHFATASVATFTCRIFEKYDNKSIKDKRKYPVYSLYHLANFLETSGIQCPSENSISFALRLQKFCNDCKVCNRKMKYNNEQCLKCLPIRLGRMIRIKCDKHVQTIKTCREFRDKWVAHAECPATGIITTYSDFLRLCFFAREPLHDVSHYMLNGRHYKDIACGGMVASFNSNLQEMLECLVNDGTPSQP